MSRCLSNNTKDYLRTFRFILDDMIDGMTDAKLTDSISHNFIVQMLPHHEAAVRMSENLLRYTTNIELQNIALGIIREQTESIENMQRILRRCSGERDQRQCSYRYSRKTEEIMRAMFTRMRDTDITNSIDCNFIREMIPHHIGAVCMCENALKYKVCGGLRPILRSIISSQRRGIAQLRRLERVLGCA